MTKKVNIPKPIVSRTSKEFIKNEFEPLNKAFDEMSHYARISENTMTTYGQDAQAAFLNLSVGLEKARQGILKSKQNRYQEQVDAILEGKGPTALIAERLGFSKESGYACCPVSENVNPKSIEETLNLLHKEVVYEFFEDKSLGGGFDPSGLKGLEERNDLSDVLTGFSLKNEDYFGFKHIFPSQFLGSVGDGIFKVMSDYVLILKEDRAPGGTTYFILPFKKDCLGYFMTYSKIEDDFLFHGNCKCFPTLYEKTKAVLERYGWTSSQEVSESSIIEVCSELVRLIDLNDTVKVKKLMEIWDSVKPEPGDMKLSMRMGDSGRTLSIQELMFLSPLHRDEDSGTKTFDFEVIFDYDKMTAGSPTRNRRGVKWKELSPYYQRILFDKVNESIDALSEKDE